MTPDAAHWAWICVDCGASGTLPLLIGQNDTEKRAEERAGVAHQRRKLICRSHLGCLRLDRIPDKATRLRKDESKTAARYDEIIKLRQFIWQIEEDYADELMPDLRGRLLRDIKALSAGWGKEGDCV